LDHPLNVAYSKNQRRWARPSIGWAGSTGWRSRPIGCRNYNRPRCSSTFESPKFL